MIQVTQYWWYDNEIYYCAILFVLTDGLICQKLFGVEKRLFKLELEYPVFAVRAMLGKNAALAAPIFAFFARN